MPFLRKFNTLLVTGSSAIRVPLVKRAVVDFAVGADWSPTAGDVKVLIDGAAAANITNLPTAVAGANTGAVWEFVLTAAELSCKQVVVIVSDAATKAIEDQCFIVETFGHASAMYAQDISAAKYAATMGSSDYTGNTVQTGDVYPLVDTEIAAIKLKTDNLPSDPADASDIAASFSSIAATLATIATYIDTEVAAIKLKTDALPSDPADASDVAAAFAAIMTTAMTESYAADGTTMTPAQAFYMIWSFLQDFVISGTAKTGRKLDGSTTSMVHTLNDSVNPTGITRAS